MRVWDVFTKQVHIEKHIKGKPNKFENPRRRRHGALVPLCRRPCSHYWFLKGVQLYNLDLSKPRVISSL